MILAVDVYYIENSAKSVGVLFDWEDEHPQQILIEQLENREEYIPGQFYKRELPCILKVLEKVDQEELEAIVVDGHVFIDNHKNFGLGGHLWKILDEKIPVIGVAKKSFHTNQETVCPVLRGSSKNALYISSVGIELEEASKLIKNMKGEYRTPAILKELDRLTKEK